MDSLISSGHINDVSPSSLLQLIEHDEQSCQLVVSNEEKGTGYLYIYKGILHDASHGSLESTDAAIEILSWDKAQVKFINDPEAIPEKRINSEMMSLIVRGAERNNGKSVDSIPAIDEHVHELLLEDIFLDDSENIVPESDASHSLSDQTLPSPADVVKSLENLNITRVLANQADIKGFLSAGIFHGDGELIATHNGQDIGLQKAGAQISQELRVLKNVSRNGSFDQASMISIATDSAHIFCAPLFLSEPSESGVHDDRWYCFILVVSIDTPIGKIKRRFDATLQALMNCEEL